MTIILTKVAVDLSHDERALARMVASGKSNSDVSAALGASIRTAESRLLTIFAKLDVESRAALAALASNSDEPS